MSRSQQTVSPRGNNYLSLSLSLFIQVTKFSGCRTLTRVLFPASGEQVRGNKRERLTHRKYRRTSTILPSWPRILQTEIRKKFQSRSDNNGRTTSVRDCAGTSLRKSVFELKSARACVRSFVHSFVRSKRRAIITNEPLIAHG